MVPLLLRLPTDRDCINGIGRCTVHHNKMLFALVILIMVISDNGGSNDKGGGDFAHISLLSDQTSGQNEEFN
uniref:Uncharacterized protein n=1 Tax=Setaria digitata TaxID=48799 RepID=A0A915PUK3_9BILA